MSIEGLKLRDKTFNMLRQSQNSLAPSP